MRDDADRPSEGEQPGRRLDPTVLRAAIREAVSGHPDVAAAYFFGSAARGRATPLSDVDVGLLFRRDRVSSAHGWPSRPRSAVRLLEPIPASAWTSATSKSCRWPSVVPR